MHDDVYPHGARAAHARRLGRGAGAVARASGVLGHVSGRPHGRTSFALAFALEARVRTHTPRRPPFFAAAVDAMAAKEGGRRVRERQRYELKRAPEVLLEPGSPTPTDLLFASAEK